MEDEQLSFAWNTYRSTYCHAISNLRENEKFSDVTLACEGKFYRVHKLILSVCSDYFDSFLEMTSCKNPVIKVTDIEPEDLEILLLFMYKGVITVSRSKLPAVVKAAKVLEIKGLAVSDSLFVKAVEAIEDQMKTKLQCESNEERVTPMTDWSPRPVSSKGEEGQDSLHEDINEELLDVEIKVEELSDEEINDGMILNEQIMGVQIKAEELSDEEMKDGMMPNEEISEKTPLKYEGSRALRKKFPAKPEKRLYVQKYRETWEFDPRCAEWLSKSPYYENKAYCQICNINLTAGKSEIIRHSSTKRHMQLSDPNYTESNPARKSGRIKHSVSKRSMQLSEGNFTESISKFIKHNNSENCETVVKIENATKAQEWLAQQCKTWLSKSEDNYPLKAFCRVCNCDLVYCKEQLLRHVMTAEHNNLMEEKDELTITQMIEESKGNSVVLNIKMNDEPSQLNNYQCS